MPRPQVLETRPEGLYCPAGGFHIDPWRSVEKAIVTHAHSDHARFGCQGYLTAEPGLAVLRARLGDDASIESLPYGRPIRVGDAVVTLFPAGHILGSAQVRVEVDGEAWVVSGDYKTEADPSCDPWEPVPCHGFVTETTFGLPVYRWQPQQQVIEEIEGWHADNVSRGRASVLAAYALGKAQRLLLALADRGIAAVVHGAVATMNRAYEASGIRLGAWSLVSDAPRHATPMVLCPPNALASPWIRRFGEASVAFASGWMAVRGIRRRRAVDRGFVLSDHVDWPGLLDAVRATGAETVWTTHGYADVVARFLSEGGLQARALRTEFAGEDAEDA
jgi:putative mRNA 3-end processing factor